MAEYLDNDEDGQIDDPAVVAAMKDNNALLIMAKNSNELEKIFDKAGSTIDKYWAQDCLADETNPTNGQFDASLEEVLHLIHTSGYATVYPDLSSDRGSKLQLAVSVAMGGGSP